MKGKKMSVTERKRLLQESPVERRRTFKDLLSHLSCGYSMSCFEQLSETSIKEFVALYPQEFVLEELETAMRKGHRGWEQIGRQQADGSCMGNSKSWVYNMINRYQWTDRSIVEQKVSGAVSVEVVNYGDVKPSSST